MMSMIKVKARYENSVLKPLEKLELGEGEESGDRGEKSFGRRFSWWITN